MAYRPAPAWVRPIAIPQRTSATPRAAIELLLSDTQTRHARDGLERYSDVAYQITAAEALAAAGRFDQTWDPQTESLTIHRVEIIRDGHAIDALSGDRRFTVVRRESGLEAAMLDGRLTGTLQLEGLRVGDIVHLSVSRQVRDPVFGGHPGSIVSLYHSGEIARLYDREIWPAGMPLTWKASDELPKPVLVSGEKEQELIYDLPHSVFDEPPKGAPARFLLVGRLQLSAITDWAEVASRMAPLYTKAATLRAGSPLEAEIARIRAGSPSPEGRLMAALRLVQDQVRYLFVGLDSGNFVPANADVTWERRFGDCKGKTALLLALLRGLGIEAQPVLVNTDFGDALPEVLPAMQSFDHVLVRARLNGKSYWLDGTRSGDRRLKDLPVPAYDFGLPIQIAGARLEPVNPEPAAEPLNERLLTLTLAKSIEAPAQAHAEQIMRGDAAVSMNVAFKAMSAVDADRAQRKFWSERYAWIEPATVTYRFDEDARVMTMTADGEAKAPWSASGPVHDLLLDDTSLGWDASFSRSKSLHSDAPYAVSFPSFNAAKVVLRLPSTAENFHLLNAEGIDQTVAGLQYKRTAQIKDGVVTVEASSRAIKREFPAAEAATARSALYQMSVRGVALRWSRRASAQVTSDIDGAAPATAVEFTTRGARRLAKDDFRGAIADFGEAAKLSPRDPRPLYNRGVAQAEAGHDDAAVADFDAALALDPKDSLALFARGRIALDHGDAGKANRDFEGSFTAALPKEKGAYARRAAHALMQTYRADLAEPWADRWLAEAPTVGERAQAIASRCTIRAWRGRDLASAMEDCGRALASNPYDREALTGRGVLRIREKRWADALADLKLASRPSDGQPILVYARGLAQVANGMRTEGAADLAAAAKVQPKIADYFRAAGVVP